MQRETIQKETLVEIFGKLNQALDFENGTVKKDTTEAHILEINELLQLLDLNIENNFTSIYECWLIIRQYIQKPNFENKV